MLQLILTETQSMRKRQLQPAACRKGGRIIKNPYTADRKNRRRDHEQAPREIISRKMNKKEIV